MTNEGILSQDPVFEFLKMAVEDKNAKKVLLTSFDRNGAPTTYNHGQYVLNATDVARSLRSRGIGNGDFVAIIPLNLPESFWGLLGILMAGAVPIPIHSMLLKDEKCSRVKEIIADCRSKILIANSRLAEFLKDLEWVSIDELQDEGIRNFAEQLADADFSTGRLLFEHLVRDDGINCYGFTYTKRAADDILIMPYTSGTTQVKGVRLTQLNVVDRVVAVGNHFGITENEKVFSFLPLAHISALIADFFGQLMCGSQVFFTEEAELVLKDRTGFKEAIDYGIKWTRPTVFLSVPLGWSKIRKKKVILKNAGRFAGFLVKHSSGLEEVRHFISAASRLPKDDKLFFAKLGIKINDIYGLTETAGPLIIDERVLVGFGSTEIIIDSCSGEILVGGSCVMTSYFRSTEWGFTWKMDRLFFKTGDLADLNYYSKTSLIKYAGRMDDMIKLPNGEKIQPSQLIEIEERIKKTDSRIEEVIVCGNYKNELVALIFTSAENYRDEIFHQEISQKITNLNRGGGMVKISDFKIEDSIQLERTPTMKLKRKAVAKKFQHLLN